MDLDIGWAVGLLKLGGVHTQLLDYVHWCTWSTYTQNFGAVKQIMNESLLLAWVVQIT